MREHFIEGLSPTRSGLASPIVGSASGGENL
jgi:hypothetical protein